MIIITEPSKYIDTYPLKDYIIICDSDKLVECVKNTLENYDEIYHKIFDNFDIKKIEKLYYESLEKFAKEKGILENLQEIN